MAALGYKPTDLILNIETGKFTDSEGYELGSADLAKLFWNGKFLLRITCQMSDGTAAVFDLSETFLLVIDPDFVHTDDTGALTAAFAAGAFTAITVDGLTSDPPDTTGEIRLKNSSDETDDFAYTSWAKVDTVYTFTGASQTLSYSYAENDEVQLIEPAMVRSEDDKWNVAGDWADLDVVGGKLSCRVVTNTDQTEEELGSEEFITPWIEMVKYGSGNECPICLDKVNMYNRVNNDGPTPAETSSTYRTATAQDSIDNTKADINSSTEVTLTDDTTTNITLETIANCAGVKVLATVTDGTNYELHDILVIHNGTSASLADRFAVQGSRISGLSWTADIDSGSLRLNAIVAGVGANLTCKYRILGVEE